MAEWKVRVPHDREMLDMACRCCSERAVRLVLDLGEQPLCNRLVAPETPLGAELVYPLRLGWCETCSMLQIDHTIPRDDMFRDYVYVSGTTDTLRAHFKETVDRLRERYSIRQDHFITDIGSNDGTYLEQWGDSQRRIGVEPACSIARAASASGQPTLNDYFGLAAVRLILDWGPKAKLITSAGSFFHMEDLHGACEGVRNLLADDGVFVCQAIYAKDMIDGNAFDQILHEHLLYYSVHSFRDLMARHGLRLFDVLHHPIHGGTMEYHVCKEGAGFVTQERVDEAVLAERDLLSFDTLDAFAGRVERLGRALVRKLEDFKAAGKSVWAYGAPGKGATLLNSFGIGPDLVPYATEKNPLKFNLMIPGCRILIVPESRANPDAFLVLAWNFLDEFRVKEAAFLRDGGVFIVPVPNVRVEGAQRSAA